MRRLLIAALALAVLGSGSAVAAKKYVIDSKKDIAPKVRKQLKGKRGKVGPTGPAGLPGQPGQRGPQGDRGPSNALFAYSEANNLISTDDEAGTTQVAFTLPPGNWLIQAKTSISVNDSTGTVTARCYLENAANGNLLDDSATRLNATDLFAAALPNQGFVAAADPQRAWRLGCFLDGNGNEDGVITATSVLSATQVADLAVDLPEIID